MQIQFCGALKLANNRFITRVENVKRIAFSAESCRECVATRSYMTRTLSCCRGFALLLDTRSCDKSGSCNSCIIVSCVVVKKLNCDNGPQSNKRPKMMDRNCRRLQLLQVPEHRFMAGHGSFVYFSIKVQTLCVLSLSLYWYANIYLSLCGIHPN